MSYIQVSKVTGGSWQQHWTAQIENMSIVPEGLGGQLDLKRVGEWAHSEGGKHLGRQKKGVREGYSKWVVREGPMGRDL